MYLERKKSINTFNSLHYLTFHLHFSLVITSYGSGTKIGFFLSKFCLEYYHVLGVVEGAGEVDLRSKQIRDQVITPRDIIPILPEDVIISNKFKIFVHVSNPMLPIHEMEGK